MKNITHELVIFKRVFWYKKLKLENVIGEKQNNESLGVTGDTFLVVSINFLEKRKQLMI